jgi:hypothetical protein
MTNSPILFFDNLNYVRIIDAARVVRLASPRRIESSAVQNDAITSFRWLDAQNSCGEFQKRGVRVVESFRSRH